MWRVAEVEVEVRRRGDWLNRGEFVLFCLDHKTQTVWKGNVKRLVSCKYSCAYKEGAVFSAHQCCERTLSMRKLVFPKARRVLQRIARSSVR